jgi:hypothetical protein
MSFIDASLRLPSVTISIRSQLLCNAVRDGLVVEDNVRPQHPSRA